MPVAPGEPQLSATAGSGMLIVALQRPASVFTEIGVTEEITGISLSTTVTTADPDAEFPLMSVTVNMTVFAPTLVQLNVVISVSKVNPPQESEVLPLTASSVIVAFPEASSSTVKF